MRINSFFSKLLIIFTALLLTFLYAQYERKKYYTYNDSGNEELVLKKLPNFNTVTTEGFKTINSIEFLKNSKGVFIHIWGSWCGPCEQEMPEFLKYAESIKARGLRFLLIAVNDEPMKIKKFMNRFHIPENVTVVMDQENKVMDLFGTLKVPETFIFDSFGKHVNKFIGPQDWGQESYQSRLEVWLNSSNYIERKIETH